MKKARKYFDSIKDDRNAWVNGFARCMRCGRSGRRGKHAHNLQIHEPERRSHSAGRWGVRANYLLLCGEPCHGIVDGWLRSEQLALKLKADPVHFCLETFLRIADPELRAPNRITPAEVVQAHVEMFGLKPKMLLNQVWEDVEAINKS